MRRSLSFTAAAALSALALGGTALAASPASSATAPASSSGYIVVLDDDAAARTVALAHADRFGFKLGHVYSSALQGYSTTMTSTVASLVAALPGVESVQKDTPVAATA
ncbi:MAG: protease inhibitor I9 family protein, partial [Candidatus Aminicenantales bacterium]